MGERKKRRTHDLLRLSDLRTSEDRRQVRLDSGSDLSRLLTDDLSAVLSLLDDLRGDGSSAVGDDGGSSLNLLSRLSDDRGGTVGDGGGGGLDLVDGALRSLLLLRSRGEVARGDVAEVANLLSGPVSEVGGGGELSSRGRGRSGLGRDEGLGRLNLLASSGGLDPSETSFLRRLVL